MCIQVTERYAVCGCVHFKHAVDPCPKAGDEGHQVLHKDIAVGYVCSQHSKTEATGGTGTSSLKIDDASTTSTTSFTRATHISNREAAFHVAETQPTRPIREDDPQTTSYLKTDYFPATSITSFTRATHISTKEAATDNAQGQHTRPIHENDQQTTAQSSVYSLDFINGRGLIEQLVSHIMQDLLIIRNLSQAMEDHIVPLTNLLTSFAIRIGSEGAGHSGHLRAMAFVNYHKGTIAKKITRRLSFANEADSLNSSETDANEAWRDPATNVPLVERINSWLLKVDTSEDPELEHERDADSDLLPFLDDEDNVELVITSAAYQWLLGQLYREFTMHVPNDHRTTAISTFVLKDREGPIRISSKKAPEVRAAILLIDWHLGTYVFDQSSRLKKRGWPESSILSLDSIENAITITGSPTDAQALTCGMYLDQTWPGIGRELLKLVIAVNKEEVIESRGCLTGNTEIRLIRGLEGLRVIIRGTIFSIAEIFEVFGWLSSAFRPQPLVKGPCCCVASIKKVQETLPETSTYHVYRICWETQRPSENDRNTCWYNMLASPMIVLGYPIARKTEEETGLEISMALIEVLLQDAQMCVLDDRIYIKSFAAMLVLTKRNKELLMWHYYYKEDGSYIDFLEADAEQTELIDYHEVGRYRHIVGWSPKAIFHIGSPWQEGQSIGPSGLDPPTPVYGFKTFSISAGYMGVNFAFPVVLGIRDPPKWIEPKFKAVEHRIDHLSRIFVVLWDTIDHRGWLIDGVSALLHLLRGSLEASRRRFRSTFRLDSKDFVEPHLQNDGIQYPEAAEEFFWCNDYHNLSLTIFQGVPTCATKIVAKQQIEDLELRALTTESSSKQERSNTTVEDEFLQLWPILAHIAFRSKQISKKNQDGKETRWQDVTGAPYLLGWDFREVMRPTTDIQPRMAVLSSTADAWIGLTRSIATVNLFGTGFGELIQPGLDICPNWQVVPRQMCYLAVGRTTIDKIVEEGQYPDLREQIRPVLPKKRLCYCKTAHLHLVENRNVLRKSVRLPDEATNYLAALIFGMKEPACLNHN